MKSSLHKTLLLSLFVTIVTGLWSVRLSWILYDASAVNSILATLPSTTREWAQNGANVVSDMGESIKGSALPSRKWAYAFLIGGCDPARTKNYIGMIYNALVATRILRESGSVADVVVMIQMSAETDAEELPDEDVRLLTAMNIRIHYLEKPVGEQSFYTVVLEKFRILDLVEYSRVIFMDSDIMPFCSLDYLFDMSEPITGEPVLKENLVLSWKQEPSNCGFFMLQPRQGETAELKEIISRRQRESVDLPWPQFDKKRGWGQEIVEPDDYWRNYKGTKGWVWEWHGVFGGQGLLYFWTKYAKKSVSLVTKEQVENWVAAGPNDNTTALVRLEESLDRPFDNRSCVPADVPHRKSYAEVEGEYSNSYPYRDFRHFVGRSKPWERPRKGGSSQAVVSSKEDCVSAKEYWYYNLGRLKEQLGMDYINVTDLALGAPALGRYPTYIDMYKNTQRVLNGTSYS